MALLHYILSPSSEALYFIDVEFEISGIKTQKIKLQFPSWRPGRYESGNFAKNLRNFRITDKNNEPVVFRKISKDCCFSWT